MKEKLFSGNWERSRYKKPIVLLSVTKSHNRTMFAVSSDLLPVPLQSIFDSAHLNKDYDLLLSLANSFSVEDKIDYLVKMTCNQAKSKQWFKFRAGRITASRFKQAVCTYHDNPSISLLKSVCYPEIKNFATEATAWGCEDEKDTSNAY